MDDVAVVASTTAIPTDPPSLEGIDLLELRLDRGEFDPSRLRSYVGPPGLLLTDRSAWSGGSVPPDPTRLDRLAELVHIDAVWGVDLELDLLRGPAPVEVTAARDRLLEEVADANVRVICSDHALDDTPTVDEMLDVLTEATHHGDIGKLAVTPTDPTALGRLVEATVAAVDRGMPVTTMAMGSHGALSRLVAIALGCSPVYGHLVGEPPIAPGQPSIALLDAVVNALNTERHRSNGDDAATR